MNLLKQSKLPLFIQILVLIFTFVSCAPEVKHLPPPDTKPHLGPKQLDPILRFNGDPKLYDRLPNIKEQTLATGDLITSIEDLFKLSFYLNLPNMAKLGYQIQRSLYETPENIKSLPFEKSPYADAILKEAAPQVKRELNKILAHIDDQQKLISRILDQRTIPAPKTARYPFSEFTKMVRERLAAEISFLQSNGVEPIIIDALKQAVANEVYPKLEASDPHIKTLVSAKTLERTLHSLEQIFTTFKYSPTKELTDRIEFGYTIAHAIDSMHTEQAALTLIIKFWRMMTPQERETNFKPNSEELYSYLLERSEDDLKCLSSDSCLDFMILIGKKKIFAGLRDYGLIRLQDTFNNSAKLIVVEQIERTTPPEIAKIPQEMKNQILPRIKEKTSEVVKIRDDFDSFLRGTLLAWAKQNIYSGQITSIPLLEKNQIRLNITSGKTTIAPVANNVATFQPDLFGSSFALTTLRWNASDFQSMAAGRNPAMLRSMLELINKLLLTYDQRPPEGTTKAKKQFDAFATGELIRGLSLISYHLRDFEPTVFDLHLGRVQIGELQIDSLPSDIAQQNLFPKETFYALAIGNAGLQLKALSTTPSPVFTVNTDNKIQWLDKAVNNPNSPNVMAGVVDIINGKRSQVVRSASLAKFLTSLIEFYKATEKLELSKAPRLLEKNSEGKTHLDVILTARSDVRDLIIGLSNFLSHQIKTEDGSTLHAININETVVKTNSTLFLEDHAYTINALLDSYELLQTRIYLWSAIDTYYALNRNLWNPDIDFYYGDSSKKTATFPQRIGALKAIARLKEFLPTSSKQQAERILQINTRAFTKP